VQCIQLAKDANRRLDKIFTELNDEGSSWVVLEQKAHLV
jgi:hypothetical protein